MRWLISPLPSCRASPLNFQLYSRGSLYGIPGADQVLLVRKMGWPCPEEKRTVEESAGEECGEGAALVSLPIERMVKEKKSIIEVYLEKGVEAGEDTQACGDHLEL